MQAENHVIKSGLAAGTRARTHPRGRNRPRSRSRAANAFPLATLSTVAPALFVPVVVVNSESMTSWQEVFAPVAAPRQRMASEPMMVSFAVAFNVHLPTRPTMPV